MVALLQERRTANRTTFKANNVPFGDVANRDELLVSLPYGAVIERRFGVNPEALSCTSPLLLGNVDSQPLLAATHIAFSFHLPLVLTPDSIWATLLKGAALHINQHCEKLRSKFVTHSGKQQIKVRRDDFELGDPDLPWTEVIEEIALEVQNRSPLAARLFDASFSTSGLAEKIAFRVCLMDAMMPYFGYSLSTLCGIPEIRLEGQIEDWEKIVDKVSAFREIGLDWWVDALEPLIRQFVSASKGQADEEFWGNMYKHLPPDGSGDAHTTGWIRDFFPYLSPKESEKDAGYRINEYVGKHSDEGPVIKEFPALPAAAPFVWRYFDQTLSMELISGLVGVSYDRKTLEVKPEFGWLVRRESDQVVPVYFDGF